MNLHGGTVDVRSDGPGKGSTFTLILPTVDMQEPISTPTSKTVESHQIPSKNILLVDDNVDAADSLSALLQAFGHQVMVCENATCTLANISKYDPQVFILDIGLPDMDGYELCRRLRAEEKYKQALFIALTGYGQSHDKTLAKHAGFDYHFVKPIDVVQLRAVFEKPARDRIDPNIRNH